MFFRNARPYVREIAKSERSERHEEGACRFNGAPARGKADQDGGGWSAIMAAVAAHRDRGGHFQLIPTSPSNTASIAFHRLPPPCAPL
jgi:hypothetical protein